MQRGSAVSKDLNQCNFIGRIGKDIELRYTANGGAVANFSIACGDDYKDKSGAKVEQTNWVNVVMFGKAAELVNQYTGKGSKIYISGKQVTRKWDDRDGNTRYSTEINANEFQFLDSKKDSDNSGPRYEPSQRQPQNKMQDSDGPAKEPDGGDPFLDEIPVAPINAKLP
jgi:single-strand DNA-binding protein